MTEEQITYLLSDSATAPGREAWFALPAGFTTLPLGALTAPPDSPGASPCASPRSPDSARMASTARARISRTSGGTGPGSEPSGLALPGQAWRGDQPQGLQPGTVPDTYPHLGFNPAPGSTDTVHALRTKLVKCADVLDETHGMITRLMDGSYWKGDAAVAFREQLEDGPLPLNLRNAARSIRKAARQLDGWESDLSDFQRRAKRLDDRARDAREALGEAESRTQTAKRDTTGTGRGERQSAGQDESDAAMRRLAAAVDDAQAELERILAGARALAWEHENQARDRADKIRDATEKLAPQEPGFFEKAAAWISENLPDILSVAAGVVALAALTIVTGGTATAILLLAAAALSAGALARRLSDPVVWESLMDGLRKGEFDADFWSNAVSVVADGLTVLPGVCAVGNGIRHGTGVVRAGAEALTLGQKLGAVGGRIMTEARAVAELENPLLAKGVHAVGGTERMAKGVEVAATSAGALSGGMGLLGTRVDDFDNEVFEVMGNAIGGIEFAGLSSGEVIALTRHLFPH